MGSVAAKNIRRLPSAGQPTVLSQHKEKDKDRKKTKTTKIKRQRKTQKPRKNHFSLMKKKPKEWILS